MDEFEEDEIVEVTSSNCNYKGPGIVKGLAYRNHYLVEIPVEDGKTRLISVRAQWLKSGVTNTIEREKLRKRNAKRQKLNIS
jgi:hypothetical protein